MEQPPRKDFSKAFQKLRDVANGAPFDDVPPTTDIPTELTPEHVEDLTNTSTPPIKLDHRRAWEQERESEEERREGYRKAA